MELAKINGPVTTVGGGKSVNFGIANNAKMFRILSDNMYQNKIGSIVREISCNALDSHIMAGTPERPFLIHLPDQFEPWFTVRDYGIGLSPKAIETVFCMYGESTKDQSNEAVGAFGLGAKTPFAYTDQFNVVSIHDGTMYSYSIFITGEGIPQLVLMAECPTTEHNGVEIKMGVKPEDFMRFAESVKSELRFFPVKPEIENYIHGTFNFDKPSDILWASDSITIFKTSGYGARVHIIQGPVGYPLDFNQINSHLPPEDSKFLRTICDVGGNLYFNIGEIGVTASREGVEYNSHTIASLKRRIALAHKEVVAWIENEIATLPTVYEKAVFINENQAFRSIINGIAIDLSPAKKDTSGKYSFEIGTCKSFKTEIEVEDATGAKVKRTVHGVTITEYSRNGMNGFTGSRNSSDNALLHPSKREDVAIVIRDTGKTPGAKMRHFFKERNLEKMYAITLNYDTITADATFIKALSDHLGGYADITLVSKMADPPRTAFDRTRSDYSRPTAYRAKTNGREDLDSVANWERIYDKLTELTTDDGDDIEKAVYVTVDRQRTESLGYGVKALFNDLCHADVIDLPLYGIRAGDIDKLAGTGIEWIKLADYVAEKKAEVIANPDIKRYTIAQTVYSQVENTIGQRFKSLPGLHPRTKLARLINIGNRAKKLVDGMNINQYMLRIAGYDAEGHPAVGIVREHSKTVFESVPMLRYVSRSGYGSITGDEATHIVEYINHFGVKSK